MGLRGKVIVAAAGGALLVAGVLSLAGMMAPVRRGTSAEFWRRAAGVDLAQSGPAHTFGGIYAPRDGRCIYYLQGYHGQSLFIVPCAEAFADYPEVIRRLDALSMPDNGTRILDLACNVARRYRSSIEHSPETFLGLLLEENLKQLKARAPHLHEYAAGREAEFAQRWARVRRYWLDLVFECVFFVALLLFAMWPWLRGLNAWRWSLHLGLLPTLLILPFYLGYAEWTFTSAGPSGGVLYPWVIIWFRNLAPWTPVDEWLLMNMPKLLEPISQPLGPMMSISGGGPLGLVTTLIAGVVIAALVWVLRRRMTADPVSSVTR